MRTIILYATKHGAAREVAERISAGLGGVDLFDLKQEKLPDLREFECVIVGSSVYAGSIRKEAKSFLAKNVEALKDKQFGIFLCGMSKGVDEEVYKKNFPEAILQTAKVKSLLGGAFDPQKAGWFERLVMRIVTKQSGYVSTIDDEKIKAFVRVFQGNGS